MYITEQQLQTYLAAIRKTVEWAHRNRERLLAEPDLQGVYKAPSFWAAVGDSHMSGTYRKLIGERFLRSDGDFRSSQSAKGFASFPCTTLNQYIYPNGWITTGMMKLGAYDMVAKALAFIRRFQSREHGGCFYAYDPRTNTIDTRLMDSSSTSSAGIAFLACGQIDEARCGGDFILKLLSLQPRFDSCFYSCMKSDGSLYTDLVEDDNPWNANSRKQKCLSAEHDGLTELTWLIGKPTKFLSRLYTATGDERYLDGAKQCFHFFHRLHANAWVNYASCKTMWAGAELYRITGETVFAETATRLLDFYCRTQTEHGCWVHTLWYRNEAEQSFPWTADITFEYGAEFSDVVSDLCAR
jgi:hypothetical protein